MSHLATPLELSVPIGEQGVVEFSQLLIQTELALGEILPHAHQLTLEMGKHVIIHTPYVNGIFVIAHTIINDP